MKHILQFNIFINTPEHKKKSALEEEENIYPPWKGYKEISTKKGNGGQNNINNKPELKAKPDSQARYTQVYTQRF